MRARSRARNRSRILLESVLIVLSVLLGFVLNEWRASRSDRTMAATVLANFRREIQSNLAALEQVHPKHVELARRLQDATLSDSPPGSTAFDVLVASMPDGGLDTPPLPEAAWEAAVSTGALRLLEYETAAMLSETYLVQRLTLVPTVQRFTDRVMSVASFDPAARDQVLRVHHLLMLELTGQERFLMEHYRNTLERLPASPEDGDAAPAAPAGTGR